MEGDMFEDIIIFDTILQNKQIVYRDPEEILLSKTLSEYNDRVFKHGFEYKTLKYEGKLYAINDGSETSTNDLLYKKLREDLYNRLSVNVNKKKKILGYKKVFWKIFWYVILFAGSFRFFYIEVFNSEHPNDVPIWLLICCSGIISSCGLPMIFGEINNHFNDKIREIKQ
jgi:hypothetical protein